MFLFEAFSWQTALMWFCVTAGLMVINELTRRSKVILGLLFVLLPIILTIFVWPNTAGGDSSTGTWFHWVKVYSALAGCLGFFAIRYIKGLDKNKYALLFPPIILAVNILEAVIRDFQCFSYNGIVDGVMMIGGPWNIMNGIAGLLNMITITGWMGIYISKDKSRDMIWPDMLWFWIIAYDLWNFAYVYNCVSDHSFYAGAALLAAPTLAAFFIRKGAWLQHRAHTLAIWMMFTMSFPAFVDTSSFAVKASHSEAALFVVSLLSLLSNMVVFIYYGIRVIRDKKNPLREELFTDLKAHKELKV